MGKNRALKYPFPDNLIRDVYSDWDEELVKKIIALPSIMENTVNAINSLKKYSYRNFDIILSAINQRYVLGKTYREISSAIGKVSPSTSKSIIDSVIRRLRNPNRHLIFIGKFKNIEEVKRFKEKSSTMKNISNLSKEEILNMTLTQLLVSNEVYINEAYTRVFKVLLKSLGDITLNKLIETEPIELLKINGFGIVALKSFVKFLNSFNVSDYGIEFGIDAYKFDVSNSNKSINRIYENKAMELDIIKENESLDEFLENKVLDNMTNQQKMKWGKTKRFYNI